MSDEIIVGIPMELSKALHYRDEALRYSKLALSYARKATDYWIKFYDASQVLLEAGVHTDLDITWSRYCIDYLGVTASRIRQLRHAKPFALAIESECGEKPPEYHLREMPNHLKDSDPQFISAIYQTAVKLAQGSTPKKLHYQVAETVITDVITHEGQLDNGNGLTQFDAALVQEEYEIMQRQKQHIQDRSKYVTKARYTVTSGGLRQLLRTKSISIRQRGPRVNIADPSSNMLLLIREEK